MVVSWWFNAGSMLVQYTIYIYIYIHGGFSWWFTHIQWIGLRENLQESPIFNGKIYGFRLRFSLKPIH